MATNQWRRQPSNRLTSAALYRHSATDDLTLIVSSFFESGASVYTADAAVTSTAVISAPLNSLIVIPAISLTAVTSTGIPSGRLIASPNAGVAALATAGTGPSSGTAITPNTSMSAVASAGLGPSGTSIAPNALSLTSIAALSSSQTQLLTAALTMSAISAITPQGTLNFVTTLSLLGTVVLQAAGGSLFTDSLAIAGLSGLITNPHLTAQTAINLSAVTGAGATTLISARDAISLTAQAGLVDSLVANMTASAALAAGAAAATAVRLTVNQLVSLSVASQLSPVVAASMFGNTSLVSTSTLSVGTRMVQAAALALSAASSFSATDSNSSQIYQVSVALAAAAALLENARLVGRPIATPLAAVTTLVPSVLKTTSDNSNIASVGHIASNAQSTLISSTALIARGEIDSTVLKTLSEALSLGIIADCHAMASKMTENYVSLRADASVITDVQVQLAGALMLSAASLLYAAGQLNTVINIGFLPILDAAFATSSLTDTDMRTLSQLISEQLRISAMQNITIR